jgi:large subunit ribosomal protein L31e
MAKKQDAPATIDEKVFTIPLRGAWLPSTRVARANRAVRAVKGYVSKHMRSENVRISQKLNEALWSSGAKKPPSRLRVKVTMDTSGLVLARMPGEITLEEEKKKYLDKAKGDKTAEGKEAEEKTEGKPPEKPAGKKEEESAPAKGADAPKGKK